MSGNAVWLSQCRGNSAPSDKPPRIAISAPVQAESSEMLLGTVSMCYVETLVVTMDYYSYEK
eukprot:50973-Pleurochrysis_carterae.AAC.1